MMTEAMHDDGCTAVLVGSFVSGSKARSGVARHVEFLRYDRINVRNVSNERYAVNWNV
jgi:hypothetical protein